MQALGHANVTVTLSIYGGQDLRRVRKTMREVEMAPFHDPYGLDDIELPELKEILSS